VLFHFRLFDAQHYLPGLCIVTNLIYSHLRQVHWLYYSRHTHKPYLKSRRCKSPSHHAKKTLIIFNKLTYFSNNKFWHKIFKRIVFFNITFNCSFELYIILSHEFFENWFWYINIFSIVQFFNYIFRSIPRRTFQKNSLNNCFLLIGQIFLGIRKFFLLIILLIIFNFRINIF